MAVAEGAWSPAQSLQQPVRMLPVAAFFELLENVVLDCVGVLNSLHPAVLEGAVEVLQDQNELSIQEAYTPHSTCYGCGAGPAAMSLLVEAAICVDYVKICPKGTLLRRASLIISAAAAQLPIGEWPDCFCVLCSTVPGIPWYSAWRRHINLV